MASVHSLKFGGRVYFHNFKIILEAVVSPVIITESILLGTFIYLQLINLNPPKATQYFSEQSVYKRFAVVEQLRN